MSIKRKALAVLALVDRATRAATPVLVRDPKALAVIWAALQVSDAIKVAGKE